MRAALARGSRLWWLAAGAWMLTIFMLSQQTSIPTPGILPEWLPTDKIGHFGIFAVLGAFLYMAGLSPLVAIAITSLYGVFDEIHQLFVPGRSTEVGDWVADTLGGAAGVAVAHYLAGRWGLGRAGSD